MRLPLSFEFFPPKTPEGVVKLRAVRQQLYALQPEFCSVTYGAGGSTHDGTFQARGRDPGRRRRGRLPLLLHRRHARLGERAAGRAQGDGRQAPGRAARRPAQRLRRRAASSSTRATWSPSSASRPGATSASRWRAIPRCIRRRARPRPTCRLSRPRCARAPTRPSRSTSTAPMRTSASSTRRAVWGSTCRSCRASCRSPARPS